jgi:hypothetical protein
MVKMKSKNPKTADDGSAKMKRKAHEAELPKFQVELCRLQEWDCVRRA